MGTQDEICKRQVSGIDVHDRVVSVVKDPLHRIGNRTRQYWHEFSPRKHSLELHSLLERKLEARKYLLCCDADYE